VLPGTRILALGYATLGIFSATENLESIFKLKNGSMLKKLLRRKCRKITGTQQLFMMCRDKPLMVTWGL
jgi:hypothetical protein